MNLRETELKEPQRRPLGSVAVNMDATGIWSVPILPWTRWHFRILVSGVLNHYCLQTLQQFEMFPLNIPEGPCKDIANLGPEPLTWSITEAGKSVICPGHLSS